MIVIEVCTASQGIRVGNDWKSAAQLAQMYGGISKRQAYRIMDAIGDVHCAIIIDHAFKRRYKAVGYHAALDYQYSRQRRGRGNPSLTPAHQRAAAATRWRK